MKIAGLEVEVGSDLKDFGSNDDGTPFIGEVYYVAVVHPEGHRWTLSSRFPGVRVSWDDEDGCNRFSDIRPWAKNVAESIARRIRLRGEINMAWWNEGRPCYGSRAYQEYGQFDDLMLEKAEG